MTHKAAGGNRRLFFMYTGWLDPTAMHQMALE
jgi:hypothetical protein